MQVLYWGCGSWSWADPEPGRGHSSPSTTEHSGNRPRHQLQIGAGQPASRVIRSPLEKTDFWKAWSSQGRELNGSQETKKKKKKWHETPKGHHHSIGHAVKNATQVHMSIKQFPCHSRPPTPSNRLMGTKSRWAAHSAWIFQTEFFSSEDVGIPQGQRTKVGNSLCQPTQYALCSSPMWEKPCNVFPSVSNFSWVSHKPLPQFHPWFLYASSPMFKW